MVAIDKAIDDLRFRVIQLRLWAGEYVNAFQFLYRHEITQATVVGRRVATTPFDEDDANVIEFDLADGEYLVGVAGRGDGWIHALEVTTSVGRTFGVGGTSGFSFTCPVSPNEEVRGLSVRTRRDVAVEIDRLKPVCRRIPGVGEARELVIRAADALFATNIIAPQARRQLQQQYNQQFKAISAVMERGILYPVAAAVEFNAISKQVQAAFNSSVFSAILPSLFEEKEDQSTQAIADAQARLLAFDQWMRNAVGAELTVLSLRTATVWPMTKIHQVIDEGLRVRQYTAFVSLFVARPKALGDVFDARGKETAGQLIDMDHGSSLRALIRARSHATGDSVPDVLRALEPQPHVLIERAVAAESVGVLAWLMTEGEIHPLGESLTPQDLVKNIGSAVARQMMLKMLAQIERRAAFSTATQALAHRDAPVQQSELLALVPSITSVYDLHVMLSHGLSSLRSSEWKEILVASCTFLTENDLVLDDAATKHLEFVLNEASRWGVFTRPECEALQFETGQAPVNAAAWTIELRSHLRQIQHYQNRTETHVQCLDLNLRRLRDALDRRVDEVQTEKLVALVAMALAAAGGPLLRSTGEVASLAKPLNLLFEFASTDDDTVGAWMATKTAQLVVKDGELDLGNLIASLVALTGTAEDPVGDEREWGSLPSYSTRQSKPKLTKASSLPLELSGDEPEIGTPIDPSETTCASNRVVLDAAELEAHVYHLAVAESGGDLERYKAYETYFEPGDAARVNDVVDVSLDGGRTTTPMPAHEYASYLGYVAIVQHMLGHTDLAPREPKLTTLRRAYDYRTRESKWPR